MSGRCYNVRLGFTKSDDIAVVQRMIYTGDALLIVSGTINTTIINLFEFQIGTDMIPVMMGIEDMG